MGLNWVAGPAGCGKTHFLLAKAREAAKSRQRVWWIGLPHQRQQVLTRLAQGGPLAGVEFLVFQEAYYRLLAPLAALGPLVNGPARVALVGLALAQDKGAVPSPGEARLFARAIAEAKHYGFTAEDLPKVDNESERLRRVFVNYERIKGNGFDYDDFRLLALAKSREGKLRAPAELVIVDGFDELGPLEVEILRGLKETEVWISLPKAPPGETSRQLPPRTEPVRRAFKAPNPLVEVEFILASLRRDLKEIPAPELAVIVPGPARALFLTMAENQGFYFMDLTPQPFAELALGHKILQALHFADYPNPDGAMLFEELVPLAEMAYQKGVSGQEALSHLAESFGWASEFEQRLAWVANSAPPRQYAQELLQVLAPGDPWVPHALELARQASLLGEGADFRRWWASLIEYDTVWQRPKAGVGLYAPEQVGGLFFRKVYLAYAVHGVYPAPPRDDYFFPEEFRGKPALGVLPASNRPLTHGSPVDLLRRGSEVVVTYPEANQAQTLRPDLALTGPDPTTLGQRLLKEVPRVPKVITGRLPPLVTIRDVRLYARCPFQFWSTKLNLLPPKAQDPWQAWLSAAKDLRQFTASTFADQQANFPEFAAWMDRYRDKLLSMQYRASFKAKGRSGWVDGKIEGQRAEIWLFQKPLAGQERLSSDAAKSKLWERWVEILAGLELIDQGSRKVTLGVWPVNGPPVEAIFLPLSSETRLNNLISEFSQALDNHQAGKLWAKAGYHCRSCKFSDVCRKDNI